MSAAAAFSRSTPPTPPDHPRPEPGSLADTLQQITLLDKREAEALHVWAKMILARLKAAELQAIRLHSKF